MHQELYFSECWPQHLQMPLNSTCDWWKCTNTSVFSATWPRCKSANVYFVSSLCLGSNSAFNGTWCRFLWSFCLVQFMQPLQLFFFSPICLICLLRRMETGDLPFNTHKVKNVLGSLLYTLAVWPHIQWRQHSSCYRYANVRVVMVAAKLEISSRYQRSDECVRLPPQKTLTHNHEYI